MPLPVQFSNDVDDNASNMNDAEQIEKFTFSSSSPHALSGTGRLAPRLLNDVRAAVGASGRGAQGEAAGIQQIWIFRFL